MAELIPTVFVKKGDDFESRFNKVLGLSNFVQIDFMDGKFVKSESISLEKIPFLRQFQVKFEAHLMVENPEEWIEDLSKKGFFRVIFHYEAVKNEMDIKMLAGTIKRYGMNPIIAINPETPFEEIIPILDVIKHVLFMGVKPGEEHQELDESVLTKIREFKKVKPNITIQLDGGLNLDDVSKISDLSCDFVNSGSLISNSQEPKATYMKVQSLLDDLSEDDGWE